MCVCVRVRVRVCGCVGVCVKGGSERLALSLSILLSCSLALSLSRSLALSLSRPFTLSHSCCRYFSRSRFLPPPFSLVIFRPFSLVFPRPLFLSLSCFLSLSLSRSRSIPCFCSPARFSLCLSSPVLNLIRFPSYSLFPLAHRPRYSKVRPATCARKLLPRRYNRDLRHSVRDIVCVCLQERRQRDRSKHMLIHQMSMPSINIRCTEDVVNTAVVSITPAPIGNRYFGFPRHTCVVGHGRPRRKLPRSASAWRSHGPTRTL